MPPHQTATSRAALGCGVPSTVGVYARRDQPGTPKHGWDNFNLHNDHIHILIQPGSEDFRSLVWTSWAYLTMLQEVSKFLIKFTLWALQAFLSQCAELPPCRLKRSAEKQMKKIQISTDHEKNEARKCYIHSRPYAAIPSRTAVLQGGKAGAKALL